MRRLTSAAAVLGLGVCALRAEQDATLVFTQEPADAWGTQTGFGAKPGGARIVAREPGRDVRVLSVGFVSACDPCVSMDGRRVLFAGKRAASDSWNIFEIDIAGTEPRQVTEGLGDCTDPEYLARGAITAPEFRDKVRWIVFAVTRGDLHALHVRSLEPVPGRGIVTWRTTFNPGGDLAPTTLSDGRVLYTSMYDPRLPGAAAGIARRSVLLTVSWSGEDINLMCGNDPSPLLKTMACELPDRSIAYIESVGDRADGAGALARVWLRRPLATREVLALGAFRTPRPAADGALLVSLAPTGKTYGLYRFDAARREVGAVVFDDPAWHDVDVAVAVPRREPLGRITMVDEQKKTALLACLDVYDTDRPEIAAIPRGAVKAVRFVEAVPEGGARILGEAAVEEDGSFLVEIVADTPFFLQTLDADGLALATMPVWMGLRPRDERSCVGCHEDKELSPRNHVPKAILRAVPSPIPARQEERRTVSFAGMVAPVLAQRCAECHGGAAPRAGLALSGDGAAKALARFYAPGRARESALAKRVSGVEPKASPCVLADVAERRAIVEWIDAGAMYDAND